MAIPELETADDGIDLSPSTSTAAAEDGAGSECDDGRGCFRVVDVTICDRKKIFPKQSCRVDAEIVLRSRPHRDSRFLSKHGSCLDRAEEPTNPVSNVKIKGACRLSSLRLRWSAPGAFQHRNAFSACTAVKFFLFDM